MAHDLSFSSNQQTIERGKGYLSEIAKGVNKRLGVELTIVSCNLLWDNHYVVELREQTSYNKPWSKTGNDKIFALVPQGAYSHSKKKFNEKGKDKELDIEAVVDMVVNYIEASFKRNKLDQQKNDARTTSGEKLTQLLTKSNDSDGRWPATMRTFWSGRLQVRPDYLPNEEDDGCDPAVKISGVVTFEQFEQINKILEGDNE